ncbi:hypothetical protein [Desulforhopalus singaporensis]|nr:hypothetical protein [Desulforhopalus singaporensis]
MVVRNMNNFRQELKSYDENRRKTGEIAVRVEAFRLSKLLKKQMRGGGAGGKQFAPLRTVSKAVPSGRRKPLAALAIAVRYWAETLSDGRVFSVGFNKNKVISFRGTNDPNHNLSSSWVRIAEVMQEGVEHPVMDRGLWFARRGGRYEKIGKYPRLRKYFFLRKSTTFFRTPARPIIDPFWQQNKMDAERNIISNYNRKMRGEKI